MNIFTLLEQVGTAIRQDATLQAWIASTFSGKTLSMFTLINNEDPPGEAEYPVVILYGENEIKGDLRGGEDLDNHLKNTIRIKLEISQTSTTGSLSDGYGTWTKYKGYTDIVQFRQHVINAVTAAMMAGSIGSKFLELTINYLPVEHYPVFVVEIFLTFTHPLNIESELYV